MARNFEDACLGDAPSSHPPAANAHNLGVFGTTSILVICLISAQAVVAQQGDFRIARPVPDRFPLNGAYRYAETNFGYPHCGIDILVEEGDTVYCVCDGVVTDVDYEPEGFGKYVCVRWKWRDKYVWFYYAHLSKNDFVGVGDSVRKGQPVGLAGSTGFSTGPHLHFEIRVGTPHPGRHRNRRNPELWFAMRGMGAMYGLVPEDPGGTRIDVYPDPKPRPPYVNYGWSLTYTFDGKIASDDIYNENWAVGDVVPGTYIVTTADGGYRRVVTVSAGHVVNADRGTGILPRFTNPFPGEFTLLAACTNPFAEHTHLTFRLAPWGTVEIRIYDLLGRILRTARIETPGTLSFSWVWDGLSQEGLPVPPGVYIIETRFKQRVVRTRVVRAN